MGAGLSRRFIPDFRRLPRAFWVLFVGTLINRTGGFVLVFLTIYLIEVRGLTANEAGLVVSAYGAGAIAGGPLGGWISDRIGRRPTLVVSLLAGGASLFGFSAVTRFATLMPAAVATGLLYELYRPVVSAAIADVVRPEDRARAYGLNYWAINLGASIAPVLGGWLAARSYRALFAVDALTTVTYGLVLWAAFPETLPECTSHSSTPRAAMRAVLADVNFVAICGLSFVSSLVFFQSLVGLPIDVRAHGIATSQYAALIALNGILIVFLQPVAGGLIADRSRLAVMSAASMLIGAGFGMNAWIGSLPLYAVSVTIWTLGEILFAPASMSLVADLAPPQLRGQYQGVFAVAFTAAFAAAPALGGSVIAHAGTASLWIGCAATSTLVALGFLALQATFRPQ